MKLIFFFYVKAIIKTNKRKETKHDYTTKSAKAVKPKDRNIRLLYI